MGWNSHCFKTSQEVENFHASAMAVGRLWSHADGVDITACHMGLSIKKLNKCYSAPWEREEEENEYLCEGSWSWLCFIDQEPQAQ